MQQTFHDKIIDFNLIPEINDDDVTFLSGIFERFPRVVEGYNKFTQTPPSHRVPLAANILETQPRTGWIIRFEELPEIFRPILTTHAGEYYGNRWLMYESSKPSMESVLEHSAESQELFIKIYRNYSINHIQWGAECMKFHDFHEGIDGDFTPTCPIKKDEKKRLEGISIKVLCQSRNNNDIVTQHIWNCTELFEGHVQDFETVRHSMLVLIENQRKEGLIKTYQEPAVNFLESLYSKSKELNVDLLRVQLADIDPLHMALRSCRMLKEEHIKPENLPKMEGFWTYIDNKLQTEEPKQFFNPFRAAYLDDNLNYKMSLANAINGGRKL